MNFQELEEQYKENVQQAQLEGEQCNDDAESQLKEYVSTKIKNVINKEFKNWKISELKQDEDFNVWFVAYKSDGIYTNISNLFKITHVDFQNKTISFVIEAKDVRTIIF